MSLLDAPLAEDYRDARDGGPAYPKVPDDSRNGSAGMSLRDWFAGQVLSGYVANGEALRTLDFSDGQIARYAYDLAEAMLAERRGR